MFNTDKILKLQHDTLLQTLCGLENEREPTLAIWRTLALHFHQISKDAGHTIAVIDENIIQM
jgi:hypothetical protein